ncbi:MAG: hypothetical protein WCI51_22485, partial [Lentisphaerota bacterium]
HGEVYLSFLGVLCVLCGKAVLALFREFSCFSWLRSRTKITFTSSRFSRMPSGLPVRYIPEGMRLSGNSQNHFGIFRETCQVYFFTAPKVYFWVAAMPR